MSRIPSGQAPMRVWEYDGLDPTDPWAVRPTMLAAIAAAMRSEVRAEQILALSEEQPEAARAVRMGPGDAPATAGAVAVIPLRGVITPRTSLIAQIFGLGAGLEDFRAQFRDALRSDEIGSIVINVDSPGGSSSLVAETADEIYAARGTKPIVAIANTMAASAAYWIACQADEFVASPSSLVGSIGTYTVHEDWSKFNEDFGVLPTYISAGKYKTEGNPDEPLSDEARAAIQQTVDDFQAMFVSAVARARGVSEATVRDGYGQGRALPASRALTEGMVDRVASYEEVISGLVASSVQGSSGAAPRGELPVAPPAAAVPPVEPSAGVTDDVDPNTSTTPPADREDAAVKTSRLLLAKPRH